MPKNIVVLSDGTGQEGATTALRNATVYQMFRLLEDRASRLVFYDPGFGDRLLFVFHRTPAPSP